MADTQPTTQQTGGEQFPFEAEVDRLLELVVHSLYSNREVFLRELISNASDAIDKLRFRTLTDTELAQGTSAPRIRLRPDAPSRTLTIEDTGIGMTRAELIEHLGTIAHSGTRAFLEAAKAQSATGQAGGGDAQLIGQFGVGFYSAFLVADRVTVVSRAAGSDEAWQWSSDAKSGFEVQPADKSEVGTAVVLHLREDQAQFTETWSLRSLVTRYSDFVQHPIELVTPASEAASDDEDSAEPAKEQIETVNRGKALWLKSKSDVTDEEYSEFYRHITHDWEEPLAHSHFQVEGMQQFVGLLFLPKRPPFDLFTPDQRRGVRLYVKRVFVMDECEELVPQWLRFVRGIIDSEDLPLNVSREILQDSSITRAIRKAIIRKSLDLIETLAKEKPEEYVKFWETFGAVLKEGLHESGDVGTRIAKLARHHSTHTGADAWTSLAEYVERMPEDQTDIYYIVGRSVQAVENSPHLEAVRARGFEALYYVDIVDEWASQALSEFEGKPLVSVLKSNLDLSKSDDSDGAGEGEKSAEEQAQESGGLLERFKGVLSDRVSEVRVSKRLTSSPVCLVVPEGGMSAHMEQLLRAHGRDMPSVKRILEINADHALLAHVKGLIESDGNDATVDDWVELLYAQALLTEGSPVPDPNAFAQRMTRLLGQAVAG